MSAATPVSHDKDRAPVCLLVLCGLPGAGKTSLAQSLVAHAARQGRLILARSISVPV